ncbi:hypothetical protein AB0C04_29530 [Micromonospora sp. NPDC048909]|uniref:hypothetical protein n=1 Tax=Micromonospora sp. NPDC048909 TaxID=3155643 RepID=UPI0033DE59A3
MTVQGVLLVTAVVWAVSLIRSVRLRAFVASLPLPMSAALLATGYRVDGAQLLGVVGLNLFFGLVALTHHRMRWPIILADVAGVAGYLALAVALRPLAVPFAPALAGTVALWLLAMLVLHRRPGGRTLPRSDPGRAGADPAPAPSARAAAAAEPSPPAPAWKASSLVDGGPERNLPALAKLPLILGGAALTGLLGQLLRGLVVTFPYAGVLVAVEVRRELPQFCRHFARNSLALVGFLSGVHVGQGLSPAVGLAAGWAGFALVAAGLHLPAQWRGKRRSKADLATGSAL